MVADPLDIAGDEQQLGGAADRGGAFHHVADQAAEQRIVEGIDAGITLDHRAGQNRITRGVGGQYIVHHAAGQLGHRRDQRQRLEALAVFDLVGALGDILGVVANPLDHPGDLQRRNHFAKIVGHRGPQRDDPDRQLVNLGLQRVDPLVAGDDRPRHLGIAAHQRIHRFGQRQLGQPAHFGHQPAQAGDIVVKGLDGVFVCHAAGPYSGASIQPCLGRV